MDSTQVLCTDNGTYQEFSNLPDCKKVTSKEEVEECMLLYRLLYTQLTNVYVTIYNLCSDECNSDALARLRMVVLAVSDVLKILDLNRHAGINYLFSFISKGISNEGYTSIRSLFEDRQGVTTSKFYAQNTVSIDSRVIDNIKQQFNEYRDIGPSKLKRDKIQNIDKRITNFSILIQKVTSKLQSVGGLSTFVIDRDFLKFLCEAPACISDDAFNLKNIRNKGICHNDTAYMHKTNKFSLDDYIANAPLYTAFNTVELFEYLWNLRYLIELLLKTLLKTHSLLLCMYLVFEPIKLRVMVVNKEDGTVTKILIDCKTGVEIPSFRSIILNTLV